MTFPQWNGKTIFLSELFSLTANGNDDAVEGNARISFWNESLENGLDAGHACCKMFSTVMVQRLYKSDDGSESIGEDGGRYTGFELFLRPRAGGRPGGYDCSTQTMP